MSDEQNETHGELSALCAQGVVPTQHAMLPNQDPHETRRSAFGLSAGFFSILIQSRPY